MPVRVAAGVDAGQGLGASEDAAPAPRVSGNYPEWRRGASSWENIPDGGDGLSEGWG